MTATETEKRTFVFLIPTATPLQWAATHGPSPPESWQNEPMLQVFRSQDEMLAQFRQRYPAPHPGLTRLAVKRWNDQVFQIHVRDHFFANPDASHEMLMRALIQYGHLDFRHRNKWDARDEVTAEDFVAKESDLVIRTKKYDGYYRVVRDAKLVKRRKEVEAKKQKEKYEEGKIPTWLTEKLIDHYRSCLVAVLPSQVYLGIHCGPIEPRRGGWGNRGVTEHDARINAVECLHLLSRTIGVLSRSTQKRYYERARKTGDIDWLTENLEEAVKYFQVVPDHGGWYEERRKAVHAFLCRERNALKRAKKAQEIH